MAPRRSRSRSVSKNAPVGKAAAPFVELGTTGLNTTGGRIWEEFLPALQGARAIQVYREMASNDPVCGAMLRAIELLIRRVEWTVEPASDAAGDVEISDFVQSCLEDMSDTWPDTLANILSFARFGFSVHEEVYKRRQGWNDDPRKSSKHEDGRIGWSRLPPRSQETIDQWLWDDQGGLTGCIQVAPPDYRPRQLPWNRLLLFRTTADKGNPEGQSVLRTAYRPWHFKRRIEEIEGIGVERDLAGLPTALVPPELLAPDAPAARKQQLAQITELLRNIRRDQREGVVFPQDFDENGHPRYELKLLSTGGRRQFDTSDIITRYDTRIAMSVLADFVLMGHEKVGSFALASSKTDLFAVALGAWLDSITEVFNRFAIPRLLRLNPFAFEEPPKLTHGDIETVDLNEVAAYVSALGGAGFIAPSPSLERHLLSNAGFPEPEDGEGLEAQQAAQAEAQQAALDAMAEAGQQPPPPGGKPPPPPPGSGGGGRPPVAKGGRSLAYRPTEGGSLDSDAPELVKYDPDQPRDDAGRWGSGGGGGTDEPSGAGSGPPANPEEVAQRSRALERRVGQIQRRNREESAQGLERDPVRDVQEGAEIRELRRQLAVAQGADPEVTVGTPFRQGTGKVDWVVTSITPQIERVLGRFVVSARSADGKKTRETTWENEIRVQPRPRGVAKFSPDQPRDDHGRFGEGSVVVQGADTSALELPGWSDQLSFEDANGEVHGPEGELLPGDTMMARIQHAQGFDGPPRVVSEAQMGAAIGRSKLELYRGLGGPNAEAHAEALRTGEFFAGRGALGSGLYLATASEAVPDPQAKAREYATRRGGEGAVVRMTLHPAARIEDHDAMRRDMVRDRRVAERRGASPAHLDAQYRDVGRYAALRGVDALRHEFTGYHVVLNRTALLVQDHNV